MRICIIGKFPPIEGGVSMRTYWTAHRLAARGHDIHVVTNAKEVRPPFRMHMRAEDWAQCGAEYDPGRVTVHWTDPVDRAQRTVPMVSAFVSKLAGLAARVHSESPFDILFSIYLEPYGVAGHLAAEIVNVPHVMQMAGSDAGRLWHHPHFEALYDHVLRSAHAVLSVGKVAQRAVARGVDPARIVSCGDFIVPEEIFAAEGPNLDLATLSEDVKESELSDQLWGDFAADRPYFGVYGKLAPTKGSFALLEALERLTRRGHEVGLVVMGHGLPSTERLFREMAQALGLKGRILQIPFLPHRRVPEFLRGCCAACCLEHDFPIAAHSPFVAREVLLSGTCLIGSTEVIRKLPQPERFAHGYNCIAVRNVDDIAILADTLAGVAADPKVAAAIGVRGRAAALAVQRDIDFIERLECIFDASARRQSPAVDGPAVEPPSTLQDLLAAGGADHQDVFDPLFRLEVRRWPVDERDWAALVAVRNARGEVLQIDGEGTAHVVVFGGTRNPLVIDGATARILELCDGQRTVSEIAAEIGDEVCSDLARRLAWIHHLFAIGLIGLKDCDTTHSSCR